jgi:hypothetical protein
MLKVIDKRKDCLRIIHREKGFNSFITSKKD